MKTKILIIIVLLMTISCASPEPSKVDLDQKLRNTIATEKEQWKNLHIRNYYIEASEDSVWNSFRFAITVKNGILEQSNATCDSALLDHDGSMCKEMISEISPHRFTVEGLFIYLERSFLDFSLDNENQDLGWHETVQIIFDPKYHFPRMIMYDHPEVIDEEHALNVLKFEPLDP